MFRASWIVYLVSVLIRVTCCPWLLGYIHPDEFFQGGQELWFGCPPTVPWEFDPSNALRSVYPPYLMTWLPLVIYSRLLGRPMSQLSGIEVLVIPRMMCALLSVAAMDCSLWMLSRRLKQTGSKDGKKGPSWKGLPPMLLLHSVSWTSYIFLSRPFTNTLEACTLALLLSATLQQRTIANSICIGGLCALGLFTRFTFVCFALPSGIHFLRTSTDDHARSNNSSDARSNISRRRNDDKHHAMWRSACIIGSAALSFGITSAILIYCDTQFYLVRQQLGLDRPSAVATDSGIMDAAIVTPWNAFRYNSKVSNLQDHGLHPRWTHALVNMFILYGPGTLLAYAAFIPGHQRFLATRENDGDARAMTATSLCKWTLMSGLGLLSLAPHQEPRFLLPLVIPVTALASRYELGLPHGIVFVLFNTILFALYGVLHQGGIGKILVSSSLSTSVVATATAESVSETGTVIFFRTYMPPTFLSRTGMLYNTQQCATEDGADTNDGACSHLQPACPPISIVDLKGSAYGDLMSAIDTSLDCSASSSISISTPTNQQVHVVTSAMRDNEENTGIQFGVDGCRVPPFACAPVTYVRPHLSTEDFPPIDDDGMILIPDYLRSFALTSYQISCPN